MRRTNSSSGCCCFVSIKLHRNTPSPPQPTNGRLLLSLSRGKLVPGCSCGPYALAASLGLGIPDRPRILHDSIPRGPPASIPRRPPLSVVHHRPRSLARSLPLPSHISKFWAVISHDHAAPEASVASALQPDPARAPHEASRALWSSLDCSRTSDTGHSPAPFSPPKLQRATCSSWVTSPPDTPSNSHVDSPAARPDCLVRRAQSQSETQDQLNFSATRTRPRHRALLLLAFIPSRASLST